MRREMAHAREYHRPFGKTGLSLPPVMFGGAALGNVRRVIADQTKRSLVGEWCKQLPAPIFVSISGQYGAGLALEMLGRSLRHLDVSPQEVVIANRPGWTCSLPKVASSSMFERSATFDLDHAGILSSWKNNQQLLGEAYRPQLALIEVNEPLDSAALYAGVADKTLAAHNSLSQLKASGEICGIGVSANDWRAIEALLGHVPIDWVVLSGLSVLRHPNDLLAFIEILHQRSIPVVVAAPFHGGFLVGRNQFNDRPVDRENEADRPLFSWRTSFAALCEAHGITPVHACLQFVLSIPGVAAVLINSSYTERVAENVHAAVTPAPTAFWSSLKEHGLLEPEFPHV